jgi:hypothetical protein
LSSSSTTCVDKINKNRDLSFLEVLGISKEEFRKQLELIRYAGMRSFNYTGDGDNLEDAV